METANLILEYLKVLLNWPLLVFALAWMFKKPLSELLRKIRKIDFPGGTLDAEADEASSEVDQVSSVTPPLPERAETSEEEKRPLPERAEAVEEEKRPEPAERQQQSPAAKGEAVREAIEPTETKVAVSTEDDALVDLELGVRSSLADRMWETSRRWETSLRRNIVDEGQYYEGFRQLAVDSPVAAVREAHQRLRLTGQRLLQDVQGRGWRVRVNDLHEIFQALAEEKLVNPDAVEPARRLDRIYRSPDRSELSAKGALSFVEAVQKLDNLLAEARVRFESEFAWRMTKADSAVKGMLAACGFTEADVSTKISRKGIVLTFSAPSAEMNSEPRYKSLVTHLRDLAGAEGISIHVNHPDKGSALR